QGRAVTAESPFPQLIRAGVCDPGLPRRGKVRAVSGCAGAPLRGCAATRSHRPRLGRPEIRSVSRLPLDRSVACWLDGLVVVHIPSVLGAGALTGAVSSSDAVERTIGSSRSSRAIALRAAVL